MLPIAQKIYDANKERFDTARNPLRSHGPDHHLRVYQHALALAKRLEISYDADVLAAACLLHDMAAYYPDETEDHYHEFDDKIAAEVLAAVNFPKAKRNAVIAAIANHGSDPKYKAEDEPVEITLLRDADKLDVFGPIGVARIVMVRTLKGDTLEQIVDDFYTHGHLERKWKSITYEAARALAEKDYEYSKSFFAQLARTLMPAKRQNSGQIH